LSVYSQFDKVFLFQTKTVLTLMLRIKSDKQRKTYYSRLPSIIAVLSLMLLICAVMTAQAAVIDVSPDVTACLKTISEKGKELTQLNDKILALKDQPKDTKLNVDSKESQNTKIKQDMAKLRNTANLERLKTMPPATLVECNRMLSDINAAIRFASDKLKP
jgi:septal ring factor EnvC (AmiA/AmiB activator)